MNFHWGQTVGTTQGMLNGIFAAFGWAGIVVHFSDDEDPVIPVPAVWEDGPCVIVGWTLERGGQSFAYGGTVPGGNTQVVKPLNLTPTCPGNPAVRFYLQCP